MRPYPPNTYGPGEAFVCLEEAQMPTKLDSYLQEQLEAHLGVSTQVLSLHLAEFFEVGNTDEIANFCVFHPGCSVDHTRPLALDAATHRKLVAVAESSALEVNQVIAILLSARPSDLFPDP